MVACARCGVNLPRSEATEEGGRLVLPRQPELHRVSTAAPSRSRVPERPRLPRVPLVVEADDTTWRTLSVFCIYRIVLALLVGVGYAFLNPFLQTRASSRRRRWCPRSRAYTVVSLAAARSRRACASPASRSR